MDQRTADWHKWRSQGIGSSDIAAVIGASPYKTAYQLWELKTGRAEEKESSFVMQRGTELEPKIRAMYEFEFDVDMPPCEMVHPEYSFARVSLDGRNEALRKIIEIKYVGVDKHEQAKSGIVPECYVPQIQWQLFVTGDQEANYVSYYDEKLAIVGVAPDLEMQKLLLDAATKFWECVQSDTPPELTEKDKRRIKRAEKKASDV